MVPPGARYAVIVCVILAGLLAFAGVAAAVRRAWLRPGPAAVRACGWFGHPLVLASRYGAAGEMCRHCPCEERIAV